MLLSPTRKLLQSSPRTSFPRVLQGHLLLQSPPSPLELRAKLSSTILRSSNSNFTSLCSQNSNNKELLERISNRFPDSNLMFGYGSGVLLQSGHSSVKDNMIDLSIVVDDSKTFHEQNCKRNPSDYALLLRYCGSSLLSWLQREYGASLFCNTLVKFEQGLIKYGVIDTQDLMEDLKNWNHLYAAGRLHKPVTVIREPKGPKLSSALSSNLISALRASLLLLPSSFSEKELYTRIAGLSYAGDFRMSVGGEDQNKMSNIVEKQVHTFRHLYQGFMEPMANVVSPNWNDGLFQQDISPSAKLGHLLELPQDLKSSLLQDHQTNNNSISSSTENDVLKSLAESSELSVLLQRALVNITAASSRSQAAKGIVTAGPFKTIQYSWGKLKKGLRCRLK